MRATRDWFGQGLADLALTHPDVLVVDCDLGSSTKTSVFAEAFPDRTIECGIAEANAIGVAAGLAQEGYRPFVASFAHFLTGKFLEIFQSVGLNDAAVVLVGTHAGLAIGKDGPTQMGLRDLSLMRTLPNIEILHPADGLETLQMLNYIATSGAPTYLRLCRQPQAEVHSPDYQFRFGLPDILRRGEGLVVVSMGATVGTALDAVPALMAASHDPTVVNLSSIPVDRDALARILAAHRYVLVVEDHYDTGGIADEVARLIADENLPVRFRVAAVGDYGQAGAPDDLYRRYELDAAGITQHALDLTADRKDTLA